MDELREFHLNWQATQAVDNYKPVTPSAPVQEKLFCGYRIAEEDPSRRNTKT